MLVLIKGLYVVVVEQNPTSNGGSTSNDSRLGGAGTTNQGCLLCGNRANVGSSAGDYNDTERGVISSTRGPRMLNVECPARRLRGVVVCRGRCREVFEMVVLWLMVKNEVALTCRI